MRFRLTNLTGIRGIHWRMRVFHDALQQQAYSLQVSIAGPIETAVRRGPLHDGSYSFAYSTKTPGTYTITATAAGAHMEGSPANVTASIAEAHAPLCEIVGTPLRISTIAGEPHKCVTLSQSDLKLCRNIHCTVSGRKSTSQAYWHLSACQNHHG